ncbi:flagella synthesis protein FlgN [Legionella maioricensis]|uniref:Flagellar protein FlgN n=1 Tax=Legionella maioricensis TaxID=2896528 RepID=A0A9X2D389_9GAMM|nr:flagellar protein FlgN [Legionella maioricensis]MCL9685606.1 flagellar protein FlgN [Legionella maioricensis]MCL9689015.1 flagellar protein FlgN [Legionella maioricensis]
MNNNIKTLATHLEQEINWVEALNTLLSEEKVMLATRQFDALEELANKKQRLSDKIEESAKQRVDLISNSNTNASLSLKEFLVNCSSEETEQLNKLNNKLAELLTTCRELNNVNGQVIVNNIHTRQQIVNALSGNKVDAVSVYTATGNLKSSPDNNHHQEA